MPYKRKEDKAAQMRRYRQLQAQKQDEIKQWMRQVDRDFFERIYGKPKPQPKKKGSK